MSKFRRPVVALCAAAVLIAVEMVLDPTGLLALVGWSGARPSFDRGLWPFAPYVVFVPVMLGIVLWVARRAGDRFSTLAVGNVLAVLLAQAATLLAMTGNLANAAWGAGYVTGKALPAAVIIAAFTRWFGGPVNKERRSPGAVLVPAIVFAGIAPLVAGQWWTAVVFAPGTPVAQPDSGLVSVLIATVLLAALAVPCLRWARSRVPGVLGGWLGAVVAGGALGVIQGAIASIIDGMPSQDIYPAMAVYVGLADGLSYGAALGWVAGVSAVLLDRLAARRLAASAPGDTPAEDDVSAGAARGGARLLPALLAAGVALVIVFTSVALHSGGVSPSDNSAVPAGYLRNHDGMITDGNGNQVLLRGVNVNQLVDFYAPRPEVPVTTPLTEQDFADIASYGFNVVRLGISWSALEPSRGQIDKSYLAKITDAVEWARVHDIYVVLDMHQDSWWNEGTPANWTCRAGTTTMWGYDGAPTWATITDSAPRCQFQSRDISPASDRAFQNFFFDTDAMQTELVDVWGVLATTFANESTVAGYDLLNEPGFGETAPATTSLQLGRFYERAIASIRAAGSQQIVFIEPSILWSGLGFDTGPAVGFTSDTNIVFSPHLYSESITMDASLGITPIVGMERQFGLGERAAGDYGTALWSGEYGFWGDEQNRVDHLKRYAALEDEYLIGGAYWVWKQACGDPQNGIQDVGDGLVIQDCATGEFSGTNDALLNILSRAYPRSAPGQITSLSAEDSTISLTGTVPGFTCGLEVWIPATSDGGLVAEGVSGLDVTDVDGGSLVTGCANGGDYTISNAS